MTMRVLMFTPFLPPNAGGIALAVHHLTQGLVEEGANVCAAAPGRHNPQLESTLYNVYRFAIPRGTWRFHLEDHVFAWFLKRAVRASRPDVIHAHNAIPTGSACVRLPRACGIPVVLTCHGEDIQSLPELNRGYRLVPRHSARIAAAIARADALVALTPDMRQDYLDAGSAATHITIIPNAIAPTAPERTLRADARRRLEIDDKAFVILAVGRNIPEKGFAFLLQALGHLAQSPQPVVTLICGRDVTQLKSEVATRNPGPDLRLFDHAAPLGQPSRCPPGTPSMEELYAAADILVMPSLVEAMGLVTAEAMAAGLPVVAFDSPGTRHVVQAGLTGLLVPARSARQLAEAIEDLRRDPQKRQSLGAMGAKAARRYDRRTVARSHLDLYEKLIRTNERILT